MLTNMDDNTELIYGLLDLDASIAELQQEIKDFMADIEKQK